MANELSYPSEEIADSASKLWDQSDSYKSGMPRDKAVECVYALITLNHLEYDCGHYTQALLALIKALKISESIDDKHLLMVIYNNMGNIYIVFNDYMTGTKYYEKALDIAVEENNGNNIFSILNNLINISTDHADPSKVEEYYKMMCAIPLSGNPNEKEFVSYRMVAEGMVHRAKENFEESVDALNVALRYIKDNNLGADLECNALDEIYKTQLRQGDTSQAILTLNQLRDVAASYGNSSKMLDADEELTYLYAVAGDSASVARHKKQWMSMANSSKDYREFNRINDILNSYESYKINQSIEELKVKEQLTKSKLRAQSIAIFVGIVLLVTILIALYVYHRQYVKIRESRKSLFNVNQELVNTEKLLRERLQMLEGVNTEREEEVANVENLEKTEPEKAVASDFDKTPAEGSSEDYALRMELGGKIISILENSDEVFNSDFGLQKLAKLVNSNTSYVSQIVNERYRANLASVVSDLRIKESRRRLSDIDKYGNWTIQAIYESVGFKNASTFNSAFKRLTGMTPSAYQKMSLGE